MNLIEDKKIQLISHSKNSDNYQDQSKGKNRFARRVKSKIGNSVRQFNEIDMNKLFKEDILDVNIQVHGETDDYLVKISFGGFLEELRTQLNTKNLDEINLSAVSRALIKCINSEDIYIHCSCPDWRFCHSYWSTIHGTNAVAGEQTSNGKKIANPNDTKGDACKHVLLVLNNNSWIMKVASVITNYVRYMAIHQQKMYAEILYPAIFNKEYTEPVQMSLFDTDDDKLPTDKNTIDKSNQDAIDRARFKPGNQSGIQFAPKDDDYKQMGILDDTEEDEE